MPSAKTIDLSVKDYETKSEKCPKDHFKDKKDKCKKIAKHPGESILDYEFKVPFSKKKNVTLEFSLDSYKNKRYFYKAAQTHMLYLLPTTDLFEDVTDELRNEFDNYVCTFKKLMKSRLDSFEKKRRRNNLSHQSRFFFIQQPW